MTTPPETPDKPKIPGIEPSPPRPVRNIKEMYSPPQGLPIDELEEWFDRYMPKGTVKPKHGFDKEKAEIMTTMLTYWRDQAKASLTTLIADRERLARIELIEQYLSVAQGARTRAVHEQVFINDLASLKDGDV